MMSINAVGGRQNLVSTIARDRLATDLASKRTNSHGTRLDIITHRITHGILTGVKGLRTNRYRCESI